MRNLIVLLITGLFAFSCNSSPSAPAAEGDVHQAEHKTESATANSIPLTLNNGEKWKADESTNNNVSAMQAIADEFKASGRKNPEDFQALQASLQAGIEKMIKECKMKGADHDALHLWLEPLMKMVKQLRDDNTLPAAEESFHNINRQLKLYPQYFA